LTLVALVVLTISVSQVNRSPYGPPPAVFSPFTPNVQFELQAWNGTFISAAEAKLWLVGTPSTVRATLSLGTGGTFVFSQQQTGLTQGEQFFVTISKPGYQNTTTANAIYDTSKTLIDLGQITLHGSLSVPVIRGFSPFTGVPAALGRVTDHTGMSITGATLADGTLEFGIDWTSHPKVNVTITKTGWVSNSTIMNIPLIPWNTVTETVALETTLRVNVVSQLGVPIPESTITLSPAGGTPRTFVDGSQNDQDGKPDGTVYIALDPLVAPTFSITISQVGFSTWTSNAFAVSSTGQIRITSPGLSYNLMVRASDELGNPLLLTYSNTSFSGLTLTQVDFSQGAAFIASGTTPGVLTIIQNGYVSTTTTTIVSPSPSSAFSSQALLYQPNGGNGPGLQFSVKIIGVSDELGNPLPIGQISTVKTSAGTIVVNGAVAYLPISGKQNVTVIAPGFVSQTIKILPSSTFQTTVLFGNATTGATLIKPGLQYSLKVIGVYDELGDRLQLGVNATLASPSTVVISAGLAYVRAVSPTFLTVSSPGYVTATISVSPSNGNQTRILFRNGGVGGDINEPGILFGLKVSMTQAWDGSGVSGVIEIFSDASMRNLIEISSSDNSGTAYIPVGPGLIYLRISATDYPVFLDSQTLSKSAQNLEIIRYSYRITLITAGLSTITLNASTDIPHAVYSTTFGITFSYSSTSVGMVNVTIPHTLISPDVGIDVTSGSQSISVQMSKDSSNTYVGIPTPPGKGVIQIIFRYQTAPLSSTSILLSPLFAGSLAFVAVIGLGVSYVLFRRKDVQLELVSPGASGFED